MKWMSGCKRILCRWLLTFLSILMSISLLSCSHKEETEKKEKLSVVTTIFPLYDWMIHLSQDTDIEVEMLMKSGVDLHSFQPSAEDIMKIKNCDLFVYVGGESDEWVDEVLEEVWNKDQASVNLLDLLKDLTKEEEIIEGMEAEESEEKEADEHIWLSLNNAIVAMNRLSEVLQDLDPEHEDLYRHNAESYIAKLKDLDERYREVISASSVKTLLFADRFPFRYLCDDYGLDYYAAFNGCSAETEASFETIIFLANKVDELSLDHIMITESSDGKIGKTIRNNTRTKDQQILVLDSMQTTVAKDTDKVSYLSIMENNLEVLQIALKEN